MVDEEFVLRFFALRNDVARYRPPLKKYLNEYMRSVQHADDERLEELRETFDATVSRVSACLNGRAFRITDAEGQVLERAPNRALFDAQMLAFSWASGHNLRSRRRRILRKFAELYEDEDFVDSISLATGDRTRTLLRVRRAIAALEEAGVDVNAPAIPT
jgi:hypothetical protein